MQLEILFQGQEVKIQGQGVNILQRWIGPMCAHQKTASILLYAMTALISMQRPCFCDDNGRCYLAISQSTTEILYTNHKHRVANGQSRNKLHKKSNGQMSRWRDPDGQMQWAPPSVLLLPNGETAWTFQMYRKFTSGWLNDLIASSNGSHISSCSPSI